MAESGRSLLTFRGNVLPPSSGLKSKASKHVRSTSHTVILLQIETVLLGLMCFEVIPKGVHTRRGLWKVNPRLSAAARQTFVCVCVCVCVWLMRPPGFSSSLGPSSSRHCLKFSWQARDKFRQVVACVVELERRGRGKRKNE
jgi:hypothetical protein